MTELSPPNFVFTEAGYEPPTTPVEFLFSDTDPSKGLVSFNFTGTEPYVPPTDVNFQFGTSSTIVSGVGTSTSIADVSGVVSLIASSTGVCAGITAVTGILQATATFTGFVSGSSTVLGSILGLLSTTGNSAGSSVVDGSLEGIVQATGSSTGTSNVSGVGTALAATIAIAVGKSTVIGAIKTNSAGVNFNFDNPTYNPPISTKVNFSFGYVEPTGFANGVSTVNGVSNNQQIKTITGTANGISSVTGVGSFYTKRGQSVIMFLI